MFQNSPCSLQSKLNTGMIRVKEQKIYGYDLLPQIGLTLFFFRVTLHINSVKFCGVFLRLLLIVSISTSLEMLFSSLSETHPKFLPSEICISGEEQITKVKFLLDAYRKTLNTSISPHKHTHTTPQRNLILIPRTSLKVSQSFFSSQSPSAPTQTTRLHPGENASFR